MNSPLYIIICDHPTGAYVVQRDLADMTREETIKDIATAQVENVRAVLEVVMGDDDSIVSSRNATVEIAWQVACRWTQPLRRWQQDFIEKHLGMDVANSFDREVA